MAITNKLPFGNIIRSNKGKFITEGHSLIPFLGITTK